MRSHPILSSQRAQHGGANRQSVFEATSAEVNSFTYSTTIKRPYPFYLVINANSVPAFAPWALSVRSLHRNIRLYNDLQPPPPPPFVKMPRHNDAKHQHEISEKSAKNAVSYWQTIT